MSKPRGKKKHELGETPDGTPVLIKDSEVVTMDRDGRSGRLDIRIADRRIAEIAPRLKARLGDRVIAAGGLVAIPGLIQGHVQTCHSILRGQGEGLGLLDWLRDRIWPLEGAMTASDVRAAARSGIAELLLSGTTTILDSGMVQHTDEIFKAAQRLGIRYIGGKMIMDHGQGYPAGLRDTAAGALRESARLCDEWHGKAHDRLRYAFSPRSLLSCSAELLGGCVTEARQRGTIAQIEIAAHPDEVQLLEGRGEQGQVEYLHGLGFTGSDIFMHHAVWLPLKERKLLAETGTRVVHCPAANLQRGGGVARVPDLLADGIQVALGTASGPFDLFAEMRLATLLHRARGEPRALPPATILHLATRGAASALGLSDIGSLEPGHRADLVLLDLERPHSCLPAGELVDRIVLAARGSDVHTVIVDGQVVVEAGQLETADVDNIIKAAKRSAKRLGERVGR